MSNLGNISFKSPTKVLFFLIKFYFYQSSMRPRTTGIKMYLLDLLQKKINKIAVKIIIYQVL